MIRGGKEYAQSAAEDRMLTSWGFRAAAPLAVAALIIGCGGTDGARERQPRAQQDHSAAPAATSGTSATYTLSGCVEEGPAKSEYVLRNVRLEPREAQPHSDTTGNTGPVITEGAWVRLTGNDSLRNYLGQRVTVTASVVDDGRNTIGAAGTTGQQTPSGEKSQASTDQHQSKKQAKEAGRIARNTMSDGTAPELRVQSVNPTGAKCDTSVRPEKRQTSGRQN